MFGWMTPPQLKGKVVLMRRSLLDLNHWQQPVSHDTWDEVTTKGVTCQLISSTVAVPDDESGTRGLLGEEERVEHWVLHLPPINHGDTTYDVTFDWDVKKQGIPGAVIVRNYHATQFLLKTITIDDVPGHDGPIVFVANSWVYNTNKYHYDRVFFTNDIRTMFQPSDNSANCRIGPLSLSNLSHGACPRPRERPRPLLRAPPPRATSMSRPAEPRRLGRQAGPCTRHREPASVR